jgi:hypothetical protein
MAEVKSAPTPESKKATATPKQETKSDVGELEYSDNRSSTAQLVSLQAAADGNSNRSNTAQLKAKASVFTGASRVTQLKAASDLSRPASSSAPVQLKAGVSVNNDPKLEREADVMGAQALQGKFMDSGLIANETPSRASNQPLQFKSAAEMQWDKKGDKGTEKGMKKVDEAEKPASNIGESIDEFLVKLEAYIDVFDSLNFKNLKEAKKNKDKVLLLEKLGMALGYTALGLGIAAAATVALGTGGAALPLLAAALCVTVLKTGAKYKTGKMKEAAADPAMAAGLGTADAVSAAAGAVTPGIGVGFVVLELGMQTKTVIELINDKQETTKVFSNLLSTIQKIEDDIKANVVPKAEAEHGDKLAQMMNKLADLKVKIKGVDAGAKAGFDQVIETANTAV